MTKCLPLPSPSNLVSGMVNHSMPWIQRDALNPPPLSPTAPPNHKVTALSPLRTFFFLIHQLCSCLPSPVWSRAPSSHLISSTSHLSMMEFSQHPSPYFFLLPFNLLSASARRNRGVAKVGPDPCHRNHEPKLMNSLSELYQMQIM